MCVCGAAQKSLGRHLYVIKIGLAVAKQVGRPQDASAAPARSEEIVRGRKYGPTRPSAMAGLN